MTPERDMIHILRNHIEMEIKKNIEGFVNSKKLTHNHPPLRRIVDDCEYCQKHGNIFVIS